MWLFKLIKISKMRDRLLTAVARAPASHRADAGCAGRHRCLAVFASWHVSPELPCWSPCLAVALAVPTWLPASASPGLSLHFCICTASCIILHVLAQSGVSGLLITLTCFFPPCICFIYLFIYVWLRWVFVVARGLSLVAVSRGYSSLWRADATLRCGARTSHCGGFSCCRAWALGVWASLVAVCGLSSCGTQASVVVARGL